MVEQASRFVSPWISVRRNREQIAYCSYSMRSLAYISARPIVDMAAANAEELSWV